MNDSSPSAPPPFRDWNAFDALWRARHEPERLATLETLLDDSLFRAGDELGYPLWWRWARLSHFRAMLELEKQNPAAARRHFEAGLQEGRRAVAAEPNRVEGHFWCGVNGLEVGRLGGKIAQARLIGPMSALIERAAQIEEGYHFAGPLRVIARITHFKPLLLGGSVDRALDFYVRALQIAPTNSTTLLYYADALMADQQRPQARKVWQQIIESPDDPDWMWEQARDRKLAQEKLRS